eukprot:5342839-Alexandrium_andersonii.AAC.1
MHVAWLALPSQKGPLAGRARARIGAQRLPRRRATRPWTEPLMAREREKREMPMLLLLVLVMMTASAT